MNTVKKVVITGVTQGLGRAMVDRFDELGWTVFGCGRSQARIEELRDLVAHHHFEVVDVGDAQAVARWAEYVLERFGAPDLLINNASIVNRNAPIWSVSDEEFANVMRINVNGTVNVIKSFVPAMIKAERGMIINMSSGWGREGEGELAPYCASKFAIEGLTQSMAQELPKTVAVVALDPGGGIQTSMLETCGPQYMAHSPTPEAWSRVAVPYMLQLTTMDNGRSLTCPSVG
ncbi:SDR family oxidoreductase [Paenibacillus guangzhouensis]|uniref:SDR family oxidoreductase n=1 Tax=Paenibacillus guangzhouensis TaxID=1473112 RepID=UPI0012668FBD|nr:SDR family oxidoreductase [Paenibacillus guangzhouensis]